MKDHGFGTGPATSCIPPVSRPPTKTAYVVDRLNGHPWTSVRTVSPDAQLALNGSAGVGRTDHQTVVRLMGLLNVTTTGAYRSTPAAPSGGSVARIRGWTHGVQNRHGFGGVPVTFVSERPSVSRAETVTVYHVH